MEHTPEDEILILALSAAYGSLDRRQGSERVHIKIGSQTTMSVLSSVGFGDALRHPAIAPLVGCGVIANQRLWTATAIPHGVNLSDAIARGPLPQDEVIDVIFRVASALEHAHAHGAVHRTLTTRSITFRIPHGSPVSIGGWTDTLIDPSVSARTVFTAPEVGRGAFSDARVDVYALGAIAYRALTGGSPPPDITTVPGVRRDLSRLVVDMLALVPRDRPTSGVVRSRAEVLLPVPSPDAIQTMRPGPQLRKPKWTPPMSGLRSGGIVAGEIQPGRTDRSKR